MSKNSIAYVSNGCAACAKFLQVLSSSPELLKSVEVKIVNNPEAAYELTQIYRSRKTPTLVTFDAAGNPTVNSGPVAMGALMQLMPSTGRFALPTNRKLS